MTAIYNKTRISTLLLPAVLLLAGCTDTLLQEEGLTPPPGADMSKFWYSRTRSATENGVMMRHHALGFSYQAVSGSKCNAADVMCQIFNLDYLEDEGLLSTDDTFEQSGEYYVERGVADIIHGTKWSTELSGDLLLYKKDIIKDYKLTEIVNDSTIVMHNSIKLRGRASSIDVDMLSDPDAPGAISDLYDYDRMFSENFRYAVDKLKANRNNVAVIDSFLNIFGTHVVTGIETGGKCDIAVKTSKRLVHTYLEEQEYTREALNLFFKKKETIEKITNQTNYVNLFRTADIDLTIRGGDVTLFDNLIANPSYDNALASYEYFEKWAKSVAESGDSWDDGMELIDMDVTPIYEFMPDTDLAKRVKVRMEASAQDMRDLYGELNFTNVEFGYYYLRWTNHFDFYPSAIDKDDWYFLCDYGFAEAVTDASDNPSKIVAVTYYENIPDIGEMYVTYPVYENRIQLSEGIGVSRYRNACYRVKWLYDRFVVEKLPGQIDKVYYYVHLYLYNGRLFTSMPENCDNFSRTCRLPDYEWPGSLDTNGNLTKETIYRVYKENDKFKLIDLDGSEQSGEILNLPGWTYNQEENRMFRNENYRYKIIPKELSY